MNESRWGRAGNRNKNFDNLGLIKGRRGQRHL